MSVELPLFPLGSVLFPGASMKLRVFERRYLDLVREVSREGRPFGICLIVSGREVGKPALPAQVGTEAFIRDFETLPDGLLGIAVEGGARFDVRSCRARDSGLLIGTVDYRPPLPVQRVPAAYGTLVRLLSGLLDTLERDGLWQGQRQLDDADWVGFRIAEFLPALSANDRQFLLQLDDPIARLDLLLQALSQLADDDGSEDEST